MQFIWPVNTDKMRFNIYIYIFLQQSLSRYIAYFKTKIHIPQILNELKKKHSEQPAVDRWRTEQSRSVMQCK